MYRNGGNFMPNIFLKFFQIVLFTYTFPLVCPTNKIQKDLNQVITEATVPGLSLGY
jgi:hypothetical protein